MNIMTEINSKYTETELHVCSFELSDEVKGIVEELHGIYDKTVAGVDEKGNRLMLHPAEMISVYAEGQKVMILGENGRYTVQKKLYELEQELKESHFVRISKSEIVNIRKIKNLDMSMTGTIRITMKNGYETYVSRRNVARIKEVLLAERNSKAG